MPSIEEEILDRFHCRLVEATESDKDLWDTVRTALGAAKLPTPDDLLRVLSATGAGNGVKQGVAS